MEHDEDCITRCGDDDCRALHGCDQCAAADARWIEAERHSIARNGAARFMDQRASREWGVNAPAGGFVWRRGMTDGPKPWKAAL